MGDDQSASVVADAVFFDISFAHDVWSKSKKEPEMVRGACVVWSANLDKRVVRTVNREYIYALPVGELDELSLTRSIVSGTNGPFCMRYSTKRQ